MPDDVERERAFESLPKPLSILPANSSVADGVFCEGIDPVQPNITIASIDYYYLTNNFTGGILFELDFKAKARMSS